jgi:hypothetical protein
MMSAVKPPNPKRRKQTSALMYFLVFVSLLFIGILIFAYTVTKRTNPIYVDERGNPVNSQSSSGSSGGHHP